MDAKPTRTSSTAEFRRQAVAMAVTENLPVAAVARRLGVNPQVLRQWTLTPAPAARAAARPEPSPAAEVRRLEEPVRQLTLGRDILQTAAPFFANDPTGGSRSPGTTRPPGRSASCAGCSGSPHGRHSRTTSGPCSGR